MPKSELVPGTVLILLAGRFRGKRVVFVKRLQSGLLLVNGPFKVNGVPLRRVNRAYVIATSTRVPECPKFDDITDDHFKKTASDKLPEHKEAHKQAQKQADARLVPLIHQVPLLRKYLAAKFTLTRTMRPHLIKF
eukprot:gnl/Spiro4/25640_TR12775_c0_g1_i1.p3 gnl/Spiro4/25640_TR12775_c0_g1~~gnl/Spiro4/25640_TR12775_c0_g1_i1.p3  ORF type:complete len:135 (-),score=28.01 gnl/Spiro4/25640_TR12775_c0_g1_i1:33-437(-)